MRIALITGASQGLGQALAAGLVSSGWALVIDGRNPDALEETRTKLSQLAPGASVTAVRGDITDPAHRRTLVQVTGDLASQTGGGLDLLVNNASTLGPSPLPSLRDYPLDGLREVFETNVIAPLALIQGAWPLVLRSDRPRIVNVTSDASVEAYPGWGGYGASKAALDLQSRVLAEEAPQVRVWAADPGDLRTRMHQEAFPGEDISDRPLPETVVPAFLALIDSDLPSGRLRLADVDLAPVTEVRPHAIGAER